jgi:hypothetical protein
MVNHVSDYRDQSMSDWSRFHSPYKGECGGERPELNQTSQPWTDIKTACPCPLSPFFERRVSLPSNARIERAPPALIQTRMNPVCAFGEHGRQTDLPRSFLSYAVREQRRSTGRPLPQLS